MTVLSTKDSNKDSLGDVLGAFLATVISSSFRVLKASDIVPFSSLVS